MANEHAPCLSVPFPLFVAPHVPNQTIDGSGFYISYNARDTSIYGCDTTALVVGQMQAFYILDGDHRAAYQPLISAGFIACLDYFLANRQHLNPFSDKDADARRRRQS